MREWSPGKFRYSRTMIERVGSVVRLSAAGEGVSAIKHYFGRAGGREREREGEMMFAF